MFNRKASHLILISLILFFQACSAKKAAIPVGSIPKNKPVTVKEEQYGHTVLQKLSEKWPLDYNDPRLNNVIEIVDKLTAAADAANDPWHVYLFKAPEIKNAAATRGNHIFVWSGMLDWVSNDDELATILGHELAHVLARHTDPDPNEEAKKLLIRIGAMAAGIAVAKGMDGGQAAANLGRIAIATTEQLGKGLLTNPYSRQLEHEADHIGLMIMSEAKFDPNRALDFWKRAANDPSFGGGTSAFFSTHPPALDRLEKLRQAIPIAENRKKGTHSKPNLKSPSQMPGTSKKQTTNNKKSEYAQNWKDKYYDKDSRGSKQDEIEKTKPSEILPKKRQSKKTSSSKSPTFAIDDPEKQSPITTNSIWRVTSSLTFIQKSPSSDSEKIGEIKRGGIVKASKEIGNWLKVFSPDIGYVKKSNVAPVYAR